MAETKVRDLTFLKEEQMFGGKALDIFKKIGTKAAITDFSILLGGYVSSCHIASDSSLKGRTGYSWSSTRDDDDFARCVSTDGTSYWNPRYYRYVAARSASLFSGGSPSIIPPNGVRGRDGVVRFTEGEYPQTAAGESVSKDLDAKLKNGTLKMTGKSYTTDSRRNDEFDEPFAPITHTEYEYNGKKYIQVKANLCEENVELSNRKEVKRGYPVWVEVEPIVWLYDEKTGIALTEKLIFAGVQFNEKDYDGDFSKTTIKKFMDTYLAKDMIPSQSAEQQKTAAAEQVAGGQNAAGIGKYIEGPADEVRYLFWDLRDGKIDEEGLRKGLLAISKTEREKSGATEEDAKTITDAITQQAKIYEEARQGKEKTAQAFDKLDTVIGALELGGGK